MTNAGKPDSAVIVGGGIVGLCCALHLRARGVTTQILDSRTSRQPASWGNAGHLAIEQVEPLASVKTLSGIPGRLFSRGGGLALPPVDISAWLPFAWRLLRASTPGRFLAGKAALESLLRPAIPAWRHLSELASCRDQIVEDGHFVIWESAATARRGRLAWSRADKGEATFRDITSAESALLGTLLARAPAGAIRFEGTARVRDPGALLLALEQAHERAGGTRREAIVERLDVQNRRVQLHLDDGSRLDPSLVVVAAGVSSGRLLHRLGYRVPIIAERGYHLQGDASAWPDLPPVVFEDRSMIVSRFSSGLRAAGFVEFSRADSPPDPRKWLRLRSHARELGLPLGHDAKEWIGCRPTLPDYLPAIGRARMAGNLLYAFGHQHLGLTLAAMTGKIVAALAFSDPAEVSLEPFALERF